MADEIKFPGILDREDCPYCPETGARCPLHEGMYRRALEKQQEPIIAGLSEQQDSSQETPQQPALSEKKLKKLKNKQRNDEGQFISALRRMSLSDVSTKRRKRKDPALHPSNPSKVLKKQKNAAEKAARLEAHQESTARDKARIKTRRERLSEAKAQEGKTKAAARAKRTAEANMALQEARSWEQKQATERRAEKARIENVHAEKNLQQQKARDKRPQTDDLVEMNGYGFEAENSGDFLARACALMQETLESGQSFLAIADRKNLEEALSLVQTTCLLQSDGPMLFDNRETTGHAFVVSGNGFEGHTELAVTTGSAEPAVNGGAEPVVHESAELDVIMEQEEL